MSSLKKTVVLSLVAIFHSSRHALAASNPSVCPYGYVGCYAESSGSVLFPEDPYSLDADYNAFTVENCLDKCNSLYYSYAGLKNGNTCVCGDQIVSAAVEGKQEQCDVPCTGALDELCGGSAAISLYQLNEEPESCSGGGGVVVASTTSATTVAFRTTLAPAGNTGTVTSATLTTTSSSITSLTTSTASASSPLYPMGNTTFVLSTGGTGTGISTSTGDPSLSNPSVTTSTSSSTTSNASSAISSKPSSTTSSDTSSTTSSPVVTPPAPTPKGSTNVCYKYYIVKPGDICNAVASNSGIDFDTFQGLNPSLNNQCTNLLAGYAYCVNGLPANRIGTVDPSSSSTTTTTTTLKSNTSTTTSKSNGVVTVSTVPPGQSSAHGSYTSGGSVCVYKTYIINVSSGATVSAYS